MHTNDPVVCVLGASGFVGSAIIEELETKGIKWVGVDFVSTNPRVFLVDNVLKKNPSRNEKCVNANKCSWCLEAQRL